MTAMTDIPTLTSLDPEPPVGTIVRDACGDKWQRVTSNWDTSYWEPFDRDGDPESWTKIAGNYGPVTVIRKALSGILPVTPTR